MTLSCFQPRNYTDPTPQPKTTVPQKITRFIESIFDNYLNTKAKGKILGIAAGVIGIILVFTIGGTYISNKNKAAEAKTEEILADARQKEQEASNAIIYRDYNTAELLLTDAQQQIENELDEKTREESEVKDLLLKIATDFDKINKVNRVNTNLVATLPSSIRTPELTGTGDALFAISKEDAKVFELNRNEQTFDEFSNEANGISEIQFAEYNEEKDTIAFLTQSSIAEMPLFSGNISNNGDDFARDDHAFSAMTIYQDRIYLLDPNNNQIYRHTRTVDGYGLGKEWIDDEAVDVTDAVSIAIDANVYVLKKDGTVLKLNVGEQEDFNLSGISDPFSENTQIITNENMNYLYILDKEHSILAVFSKKGELLNQYAINLPDTITDFHVDEENQIVYMLTNSEVHSIDIQE